MTKKRREDNSFEGWWDDHPFMKKFYVPLVLTATFVVTVIDAMNGARGR